MRLHPATLLGLWMALVVALPGLGPGALAWVSLTGVPVLLRGASRTRFLRLLRRTWLLFAALFLVYGVDASSAVADASWGEPRGLSQGLAQAHRLILILATLSWLLTHLGQNGLLAGLYTLLRPLARLGLPSERFTVRLALVLGWAEEERRATITPARLAAFMVRPPPASAPCVVLDLPAPGWQDGAAVLVWLLLLRVLP